MENRQNFNLHIGVACGKLSKIVGIFRNLVPDFVLVKLYYSMVYPYLVYCYLAWGGATGICVDRLFVLQKKIIRLMDSFTLLTHSLFLSLKDPEIE